MYQFNDFTIDTSRYKPSEINEFSNLEEKTGVHWVPIIDVGIGVNSDAAKDGKSLDVFIKSGKTNQDLVNPSF